MRIFTHWETKAEKGKFQSQPVACGFQSLLCTNRVGEAGREVTFPRLTQIQIWVEVEIHVGVHMLAHTHA